MTEDADRIKWALELHNRLYDTLGLNTATQAAICSIILDQLKINRKTIDTAMGANVSPISLCKMHELATSLYILANQKD